MLLIKKPSAWIFDTSSTGGIGVEFVAAEGGALYLFDPKNVRTTFYYGAAGAGLSWGVKLPKIGKIQLNIKGKGAGGVIAPAAFPNGGKMYVLEGLAGDELTASDIRGVCIFAEVGGGLIAGVSATAMLVGINPVWLAALAAGPNFAPMLTMPMLESAKGLLVMGGVNVGIQGGAGVGEFLGGLI